MRLGRLAPFAGLVVLAILPATAGAQNRFLAQPLPLTGAGVTGGNGNHALAMDPAGGAAALWGGVVKMQASLRAPSAGFGPVFDVDPDDGSGTALPELDDLPSGQMVAAWRGPDEAFPPLQQVFVAVKPPGASAFGAPLQVSTETQNVANVSPNVALLPDGKAVVVWKGENNAMDTSSQVRFRLVSAAGVPEGTPVNVSGTNVDFPDVDAGTNGAILITWRTEADTVTGDQATAYFPPDSFAGDFQLIDTNSGAVPVPLVDPAGNALVAYRSGASLRVQARPAGTTENFGAPETVNPVGSLSSSPVLGHDAAGNATMAYSLTQAMSSTMQVATRPAGVGAGQEFGPPAPVDSPTVEERADLDLSVNDAGAALLSWRDTGDDRVFAAARPAGAATFGAPTPSLVATGRFGGVSRTAIDASGRGVVTVASAAADNPGATRTIDVVPYDDVPRATGLQVPASGFAQESLSFSVSPVDPWAAVTGVNWEFGDGGSATGAQVSHAYASPGSYTARLTLTDDRGNSTVSERLLVVAKERRAPRITRARMLRKRFRVARKPTARSAAAKAGTAFLFTLSEPASVKLTIQRALPGRRSGRRCVKPRRALQSRKRCTRYVPSGTLVRAGLAAGARRVSFSGRIGRRALRPGAYRALIVATDLAGNRGRRVTLRFRVVRR